MSVDFNRDHFALFGLTPSFVLDAQALDRAYRDLQAEIHPDRFAHAGDAEQRLAAQWSARANEAYQTLRDPFGRARYLLLLQGIDVLDARHTALSPEFLMQQMEWREALAAAVSAADTAALDRLERQARDASARQLQRLEGLLDSAHDYPAAAEVLRQYRFLDKFLADIGDAYEEIA